MFEAIQPSSVDAGSTIVLPPVTPLQPDSPLQPHAQLARLGDGKLADDIEQNRVLGTLSGFVSGLANPPRVEVARLARPLGGLASFAQGVKSYADDALLKPLTKVLDAAAESHAKMGEERLQANLRVATLEVMYSSYGRMLAALCRLWNGLEVPWTANDAPTLAEGSLEYASMTQRANVVAAAVEARGDAVASALNVGKLMK